MTPMLRRAEAWTDLARMSPMLREAEMERAGRECSQAVGHEIRMDQADRTKLAIALEERGLTPVHRFMLAWEAREANAGAFSRLERLGDAGGAAQAKAWRDAAQRNLVASALAISGDSNGQARAMAVGIGPQVRGVLDGHRQSQRAMEREMDGPEL
jgi:hypothetical protein